MNVSFENVLFPVTIQAELLRFIHEEISILRSVRIVADKAAARGNRAMDLFLREVQHMAIETDFLFRQDELIAAFFVAGVAEFCSIGTVLSINTGSVSVCCSPSFPHF